MPCGQPSAGKLVGRACQPLVGPFLSKLYLQLNLKYDPIGTFDE